MTKLLSAFRVVTFDCYGTLIDWETGIVAALATPLARAASSPPRDVLLAAFGESETAQQQARPDAPYPAILAAVARDLAARFELPLSPTEAEAFGASVGDWPAFADSASALRDLKRHFELVVLSNVDRASFAKSNARLGVTFDMVITAEDVGAYKPDPRMFERLLDALAQRGHARDDILHTAQSLYHDHVPARRAGLATCWIDRRGGRGGGATPPPGSAVAPDYVFGSLAELAAARRDST